MACCEDYLLAYRVLRPLVGCKSRLGYTVAAELSAQQLRSSDHVSAPGLRRQTSNDSEQPICLSVEITGRVLRSDAHVSLRLGVVSFCLQSGEIRLGVSFVRIVGGGVDGSLV